VLVYAECCAHCCCAAKALDVKGSRVFQAVTASPKNDRSGVSVDQLRSTGASYTGFVKRMTGVALACGMAADGLSERCAHGVRVLCSCMSH
jgi:hypothetical protein